MAANRRDFKSTPAAGNDPTSDEKPWPWMEASPRTLLLAAIVGGLFGFFLQKGGVAKLDILIGALLLENFVVVKVMLSAIIVGMIGLYVLRRFGVVEEKQGETVYGKVLSGGLIFGVGFGLLGYCPGTDAAAVGQGNFDAWAGIAGMLAGSYIFARWPHMVDGRIFQFGRPQIALVPELIGIRQGTFLILAVMLIIVVLVLLEMWAP